MVSSGIQIAASRGLMRMDIDGDWSVRDIWHLFMNLHLAHERAAILAFLAERPSEALTAAGTQPEVLERAELIRQGYDPIGIAAERATATLALRRMRYGSPGWIEAVGHLLPLQVILNFILQIRAQNTERQRLNQAFQLELLDRMPGQLRKVYAANLLMETQEYIEPLANDPRVHAVAVAEIDE